MDALITTVTDRQFQISLLVALAAIATVYTIIEPFLVKDKMAERMKSVAEHRERLRSAQRESFARKTGTLRAASAQGVLKGVVEKLKLLEAFDANEARKQLVMAGYRGQRPVFIFMTARIGMPFVAAFACWIYVYILNGVELDSFGKLIELANGITSNMGLNIAAVSADVDGIATWKLAISVDLAKIAPPGFGAKSAVAYVGRDPSNRR